MEYTAEQGLGILRYLGIKINETECRHFRLNWDSHLEKYQHPLIATLALYADTLVKLKIVESGNPKLNSLRKARLEDFKERAKRSELEEQVAGSSLEAVLAKEPHVFYAVKSVKGKVIGEKDLGIQLPD
ncbi:hypothetical protein HYZ97_01405 [Candidatus Pacearchaeota archaeon]|nr:hypothetical protein [Candidatus Pacearchaeota archaeon]